MKIGEVWSIIKSDDTNPELVIIHELSNGIVRFYDKEYVHCFYRETQERFIKYYKKVYK